MRLNLTSLVTIECIPLSDGSCLLTPTDGRALLYMTSEISDVSSSKAYPPGRGIRRATMITAASMGSGVYVMLCKNGVYIS